jgi:TolB protein
MLASALACLAAGERSAWSPERAELLFSSTRDGNAEVYVRRAGESEWVNLTNHESTDNWPVWSPDGSRIAFQSNRAGKLDIFTMRADGSEQVQLTTHPESDYLPSWSPDGKTILFTSWRREEEDTARAPHVYAMNADGSNQRRLVRRTLNTSDGATWSPDGRRIVFSRKGEKGADVYLAGANGGGERRLTFDQDRNLYNGAATFSPDGRWIAFYSADDSSSALHVMTSDGGRRRTLVRQGHNWYPRWSPDGRWILYTAAVPGGEQGDIDLFAVPVDGAGSPIVLARSPRREQEGSWRPR